MKLIRRIKIQNKIIRSDIDTSETTIKNQNSKIMKTLVIALMTLIVTSSMTSSTQAQKLNTSLLGKKLQKTFIDNYFSKSSPPKVRDNMTEEKSKLTARKELKKVNCIYKIKKSPSINSEAIFETVPSYQYEVKISPTPPGVPVPYPNTSTVKDEKPGKKIKVKK
jgi:hypothetical protein